jgi:hypothetical protein
MDSKDKVERFMIADEYPHSAKILDLFNNPAAYRTSLARNPAGFNVPHFAVFSGSCLKTSVFKQLYY